MQLNIKKVIGNTIFEFFSYAIIASCPFLAVYIDLFYLGNIVGEESVVENTQIFFLALMIFLFIYESIKYPQFRAGFILIAGFFSCMLIREKDNLFDNFISHGSWVYFALFVAVSCIIYAIKNPKTAFDGLHFFVKSREYGAFLIGLMLVLVASRLLGMGIIWKFVLGNEYSRTVKHIVEECTELLGYAFMLNSVIRFVKR